MILKIHILPKLTNHSISLQGDGMFFFSSRKLSHSEIVFLRNKNIKRYYLKPVSENQKQKFFHAFEGLWEKVIKGKGTEHRFWRNSVSSKMQEWENAAGYLALVLFSLSNDPSLEQKELIVLPDSCEEAFVWRSWALSQGWRIASFGFSWPQRVKQEIGNVFRAIRLIGIFIIKKFQVKPNARIMSRNPFLVVTLFYRNVLYKNQYEDQFFGTLSEDIQRSGHDCFYLGDTIDRLRVGDGERLNKNGRPSSIYSLLSWFDLFAGFWFVFTKPLSFKSCDLMGIDFSSLLSWNARRAQYDYNLTAEFFYRAVRYACRKYRFDKMLYAFEGNVYERAAVQAFRQSTSAPIDAYSHAVLYPLNLKLYLSVSEAAQAPEPGRYLVAGDSFLDALRGIRRVGVQVVSVCSLRSIPRSIEQIKEVSGKEILVVLDGLWSTTNMLNWLYEHQDVFKNFKVILRPHPNVSGSRLFDQCPQYCEGLFEVSDRSLQDDLQKAWCVLYRQSSVGIIALMNGIPIIHLNIDLPLGADPLEDLADGKISVTNEKDLEKALRDIPLMRKQLFQNRASVLAKTDRYFVNRSSELLKPFLDIYAIT